MATEQGVVLKTFNGKALVKAYKTSACEGCASKDTCVERGREMEVEVVNAAGAKAGDRVVVEMETRYFLKATFFLYVFPILCLLAGALAGEKLSIIFRGDASLFAMGTGFACFALAILVVKIKGRKMGEKDSYRPRIIRVMPGNPLEIPCRHEP